MKKFNELTKGDKLYRFKYFHINMNDVIDDDIIDKYIHSNKKNDPLRNRIGTAIIGTPFITPIETFTVDEPKNYEEVESRSGYKTLLEIGYANEDETNGFYLTEQNQNNSIWESSLVLYGNDCYRIVYGTDLEELEAIWHKKREDMIIAVQSEKLKSEYWEKELLALKAVKK